MRNPRRMLTVAEVTHETTDAVTIAFAPDEETSAYQAGQFLTLRIQPNDPSR